MRLGGGLSRWLGVRVGMLVEVRAVPMGVDVEVVPVFIRGMDM